MSFIQNGSFEALAQASAEKKQNKSSESNPFGLKHFSKLLDAKFGNSAFSDNILPAPKGNIAQTNPFDRNAVKKLTPTKTNQPPKKKDEQTTISIYGGATVNKASGVGQKSTDPKPDGNSTLSATSIFDGLQINKGTGFAKGGAGRHKLDFCY